MKKTDRPGYYKVDESIVLNSDSDALTAYKNQKLKNARLDKMEIGLQEVKKDMEEIKNLLKGILNK